MKTRIARGAGEVEQEAIPNGIVDMPGQRVGTYREAGDGKGPSKGDYAYKLGISARWPSD